MITTKEKTLVEALNYCMVRELPPADDKKSYWIKAIALVSKNDGSENYAIASIDVNTLEPKLVKDFGSIALIREVKEYYPYDFLKENFMPPIELKTKEKIIEYLKKVRYYRDEHEDMSLKELKKELVKRACTLQINSENNA